MRTTRRLATTVRYVVLIAFALVMVAPLVASVAVVALLLLPSVMASEDWARSLDAFRREVGQGSGVAIADELLPPERRDVLFGWTASSLSLIVRGGPTDVVLVDRTPSLVPLPPEAPRSQLPDEFYWR